MRTNYVWVTLPPASHGITAPFQHALVSAAQAFMTHQASHTHAPMHVCLFVFICSTMRFFRLLRPGGILVTHNHSAIPEVTLKGSN
jgi:predicted methyltransferase